LLRRTGSSARDGVLTVCRLLDSLRAVCTHPGEVLFGYALELIASALRGARIALGSMIGDADDGNVRPPATDGRASAHSRHDERRRSASAPRTADDPAALRDAFANTPPLPASYGDDRLVLLARDPGTLFAYWDLAPGFDYPPGVRDARLVLRIEDLTLLDFEAARPWRHHDFDVEALVGSRYVEVARSDGTYRAQLGWRRADGSFVGRVQSSTVTTPRADAPGSEPVRWMTVRVEDAGRGRGAPDAPARLAVEETGAPRGAPAAGTTHAPARAPASAEIHGRPSRAPSSADLRRRAPSSEAAASRAGEGAPSPEARAPHRRGR